ncbi:flavin reductase [Rhodobacteraceae bacterium 2CG4]|uniref:Flavin reductase n=1 Tax=Halovulum marinum TaxID=2662447 RepID=A0A6L5Z3H5_9RHOB|nr:flavin reductase family protein [Halovulum marinum]MSU91151.1 flavin reductase [Halovulum marinum]
MSRNERALRDALGRYATGVTVVTTQTARGPLGITANSFAAVSLDPPLVLWSPARRSRRFPAFEAASHFAIHVLTEEQRWLAERFARSGGDFAGIETTPGLGGAPLIAGCAARLECQHAAQHEGGDHLILVGEVRRFAQGSGAPLIFFGGDYRRLGGPL